MEYVIGKRVSVRNDAPRPPDRFTRKLRAWKNGNFDGTIIEVHSDHIAVQTLNTAVLVVNRIIDPAKYTITEIEA